MKNIYNNRYSELPNKNTLFAKIVLIFLLLFEFVNLYGFLRDDNYSDPLRTNPHYAIARVEVEDKIINGVDLVDMTKLNVMAINFESNEVQNISIPVSAVGEYECSDYSSYINQMYYTQSNDCFLKSIESILNVPINETVVINNDDVSDEGGYKIHEAIQKASKMKKLTIADQLYEVDKYSYQEWSTLFGLYDFDASLINETSTSEFQKQLQLGSLSLDMYDIQKYTIETENIDGLTYMKDASRQKASNDVRNLLDTLTSKVGVLSAFEDNGSLGFWPEIGDYDKYDPELSDKDFDLIPDFYDSCPLQVPTLDENLDGCQDAGELEQQEVEIDSDLDGIFDSVDSCPFVIGNSTDGCYYQQSVEPPNITQTSSDADNDGVVDGDDLCPSTVGNSVDGCYYPSTPTDSDGDGINDINDSCPNTVGNSPNGCYIAPEQPEEEIPPVDPPIEEEPPISIMPFRNWIFNK